MTRLSLVIASLAAALPAYAHPGHVAESQGHTHFADHGAAMLIAACVLAIAGFQMIKKNLH